MHPHAERPERTERPVPVEHGVTRELIMIASVVAMGILAAVAITLPALAG
ncbi:MAG: hypothetical protein WBQ44_19385 [Rhodococcus sp. (in: high G+C Gram-positive bacteria)]